MPNTSKGKAKTGVPFRDYLVRRLRKDPDLAHGYLRDAWDDEPETFLVALRDVVDAQGGVTRLAKKTGLHRVSLHTLLSAKGNPRLDTLSRILSALKIRATFGPQAAARRAEPRRKKKAG
jgi:probable addiction module antidote protein